MGISNTVIQNQFSQKLEWEANNFALEKLDQLGLSRESFAESMQRLADLMPEEHDSEKLFSSHPLFKERIMNARGQKAD